VLASPKMRVVRSSVGLQNRVEHSTPEKILQVASKLFAEKGYSNVSIRDVCREAGTTAPVIYYHFRNKRGLFDAAARRKITMKDFITKLRSETVARSPKKSIQLLVRVYLSSFPESAFEHGLYLRESASLDKESARMISEDLDMIHSLTTSVIQKGIERGEFKDTDASLAADCLLGMLNRAVFQRIHFSRPFNRESYSRYVTDFFFRALD